MSSPRMMRWHRNAALVAPLLLVNTAAIYGQSGWAYDHLGRNPVVAVLFAVAVESIGVFLAAEAHAALMAGHASAALRLGSYAVGALVGVLNYAHYATAPGYRPNPLAVTFGLLSSVSPWLWAIRSRSMNRERLAAMGLIDPRAVKFSRLRWALFPIRTFAAFRAAVWAGITRPDAAVAAADSRRTSRRPAPAPVLPAAAASAGQTDTSRRAGVDASAAMAARPRTSRKPPSADKVAKAAARLPGATVAQVAARAGVSESTARRHLPAAHTSTDDAAVASANPHRPAATPIPAAA